MQSQLASCQNYIYGDLTNYSANYHEISLSGSSSSSFNISKINCTLFSFSAWIKLNSSTNILDTIFELQGSNNQGGTVGNNRDTLLHILRNDTSSGSNIYITAKIGNLIGLLIIKNVPRGVYMFLYTGIQNQRLFYVLINPQNAQNILDKNITSFSNRRILQDPNRILDDGGDDDNGGGGSDGNNGGNYYSGQSNISYKNYYFIFGDYSLLFKFYYDWVILRGYNSTINTLTKLMNFEEPVLVQWFLFASNVSSSSSQIDNTKCSIGVGNYIQCNLGQYANLQFAVDEFLPIGQMCFNVWFTSMQNGGLQTLIHIENSNTNTNIKTLNLSIQASLTNLSSTTTVKHITYTLNYNSNPITINSTFNITLNNWTPVCFTFTDIRNGSSIFTIYHSGNFSTYNYTLTQVTLSRILTSSPTDYIITIGSYSTNGHYFDGQIKNLRIYNNPNSINLYGSSSSSTCKTSLGLKYMYYLANNGSLISQNNYSCYDCLSNGTSKCDICNNGCCDQNCLACTSPSITNSCLSCYDTTSYPININQCTLNAFIPNCSQNCASCIDPQTCIVCQNQYFLYQDACKASCPDTYYQNDVEYICSNCSLNCLKCIDTQTCNQCQSGYFLYQAACYQFCPNNTSPDTTKAICVDNQPTNLVAPQITTMKLTMQLVSSLAASITIPLSTANLWMWLSNNQLIYLMNFLNITIPDNLKSMLDNRLYDLIKYLIKPPIDTSQSSESSYPTFSMKNINSLFFKNGLLSIIIITISLSLIFLLTNITKNFIIDPSNDKKSFFNSLKKITLTLHNKMKWSFILRYITASYCMVCFYAYIQILYCEFSDNTEISSYFAACGMLLGQVIFPIWSIYFLKKNQINTSNVQFTKLYGSLYSEYSPNSFLGIFFGPISLLWMNIFVGMIVIAYSYPLIVISVNSILLLLLFLNSLSKPYKKQSLNYKILAANFLLTLSYASLLGFLYLEPDSALSNILQWSVMLYLMLLVLIDILYVIYEFIIVKFSKCCEKKKKTKKFDFNSSIMPEINLSDIDSYKYSSVGPDQSFSQANFLNKSDKCRIHPEF